MASNDVSFNIGVSINKNSVSEVKRQIKSIQTEVTNLADKYKTAASVSANSKDSQVKEWRTDIKGANTDITNFNKTLKLYEQQLELLSAKEIELKEATKERNKTQSRLNTAQAGLENTKVAYTKGEIDADTYQAKTSSYEDKIKLETEKLEAQKAKVVELRAEYNAIKAPLKGMETTLNASYNNIKQTESSADAIFNKSGVIYKNADGTANATAKIDSNTKATASDADAVQNAFKETASEANGAATATKGVKDATKQAASSSEGAKKIKDVFKDIRDKAVDSSSSILEIVQKIAQLRSEGQDASSTVSLLHDKLGGLVAANEDAYTLNQTIRDMNSALKFINADNVKSMGDVFNSLTNAIVPQKQALSELNSAIKTTGNTYIQTAQQARDALNTKNTINSITAFNAVVDRSRQQFQTDMQSVIDTTDRVSRAMSFDDANVSLAELLRRINDLKAAQSTLESWGLPREMDARYTQTTTLLAQLNSKVRQYQSDITQAANSTTSATSAVQQLGSVGATMGTAIRSGAKIAKSALTSMTSIISGVKSGFSGVKGTVNRVQSSISGLASSVKSNFKTMLTSLTKYVLGFRSLFFLVRRLRTYIGQGIQNIVQWNDGDNEVNEAITDLLTSLLYLKNAWAAAFSPIITYVRPWLVSLINTVADVGNTIARFIGYLTGQTLVFNAVRVQAEDYADSLDDTGSSASGAADEVENLTDRLAAFDDLNVLGVDDDNGSGSGGGGSGDDDTYSPDANDMFKLVENEESTFLSLLKSSWENADFTEVGEIVKDKLISIFTIDWEKDIYPNAIKIGSSFGTFLSGLLGDPTLYTTVGEDVAGAINSVTYALQAFLDETKDLDVGGNLAEGLNAFLNGTDWNTAGSTINEALTQITTNINSFLDTLDADAAAQAITEFFEGLNAPEIIGQTFTVSVKLVASVLEISQKAINNAKDDLADWLEQEATKTVTLAIVDEQGNHLEVSTTDKDWLTDPVGAASEGILFDIGKWFSDAAGIDTIEEVNIMADLLQDIHDFLLFGKTGEEFIEIDGNSVEELADAIQEKYDKSLGERMQEVGPPQSSYGYNSRYAQTNPYAGSGVAYAGVDPINVKSLEEWSSHYTKIVDETGKQAETSVKGSNKNIQENTDQTWSEMTTNTNTTWQSISSTISENVLGIITNITTGWNDIKTSVTERAGEIRTVVSEKFEGIRTMASGVWEGIKSDVQNSFNSIASKLAEVFTDISKRIKPPINGVITVVESMANKILLGINGVIDKINEIPDITFTNPFTGTDYKLGFEIPRLNYVHLPRLAQGAVIPPNKEFMAVLGDQKSGTNIEAPLDTIKQAVAEELSEQLAVLQDGFASVVQAINNKDLSIGDKQIGQANARYTAQQARIRGVNW